MNYRIAFLALSCLVRTATATLAQSPIGEFARIVSIPQDCQTARELRRAELAQRARAFASSEVCRAVLNCFEMVRSQATAGLDFLKRHPEVDRAFRDQLQTTNPRDPRVNGWLTSFGQRLSSLNSVANVPSYSDCGHRGRFIDEWVRIIQPRLSPPTGLFDPSKGLFENFSIVGHNVLTNARSDYKTVEAEYNELIGFNDNYAGVERFQKAQAAYRTAFENDDVAGMIRKRSNVLREIEHARERKLLLSRQTEELVSLESSLSNLTATLGQGPISKLISRDVRERSAELQSQARKMRETPPRLRGDVDTKLKELKLRENDLQIKTAAAQAKLDSLKRQDERRIDTLAAIARILPEFADESIQRRLDPRATTMLANLHDSQTKLLGYSNMPPVDQPDYDDVLKNVDNDLVGLRSVQDTIRRIGDSSERIGALKATIDKSDLLDAKSKVDMLSNKISLIATKSLPLTHADENQLSEASNVISQLEKDIPAMLHTEEIKKKGLEYANKRETSWRTTSKRNEMTDRVDVYAQSTQKNGQGAVAHVTGYCERDAITFSALIVDEAGKPTIGIPMSWFNAQGQIRINDQDPEQHLIPLKGSFTNELKLISFYRTSGPMNLSETWRVFIHFDTSVGEMLIKIPIYDPSVQQMIGSCS